MCLYIYIGIYELHCNTIQYYNTTEYPQSSGGVLHEALFRQEILKSVVCASEYQCAILDVILGSGPPN